MRIFLLMYFAIYGGMQVYMGWKLWPVLTRPAGARWVMGGFLLLMLFGPMLARYLERAGPLTVATGIGAIAWTWMAVSLWFLAFGLVVDVWNLGAWVTGRFVPAAVAWKLSPRALVSTVGVLILAALGWGHFVQARWLKVQRVDLTVPRLPEGRRSLTVALVSDLHLGLYADPGHFEKVIVRLRELNPDLIVSAGDMLDSEHGALDIPAAQWRTLSPPLGKLAVLGNHDFYAGADASLKFHEQAGFRLLRAERVELAPGFIVAGVDDPASHREGQNPRTDERAALPPAAPKQTVILLKHQPRVVPDSAERFALQLSGHSHNGQLFPFTLVIAAIYPYHYGLYELPGGAHLYVSPGTGTWGPQIRLFTTSEITLFALTAAK